MKILLLLMPLFPCVLKFQFLTLFTWILVFLEKNNCMFLYRWHNTILYVQGWMQAAEGPRARAAYGPCVRQYLIIEPPLGQSISNCYPWNSLTQSLTWPGESCFWDDSGAPLQGPRLHQRYVHPCIYVFVVTSYRCMPSCIFLLLISTLHLKVFL